MPLPSVLIVDDSETDRYIMKRLLTKANITDVIFEAENGYKAIRFLENFSENAEQYPECFPPQLVFLDINMHLMNGFEFLADFANMREENPELQSLVLMIFTSSNAESELNRISQFPFVKCAIKKMPDSANDLKKVVKKFFPALDD
ncbi:MAG: response regulator [Calditrichia bacterium]